MFAMPSPPPSTPATTVVPRQRARHRAVAVVQAEVAATRQELLRPGVELEPTDGSPVRGIVVALAVSAPFWAVAVLALGLSR